MFWSKIFKVHGFSMTFSRFLEVDFDCTLLPIMRKTNGGSAVPAYEIILNGRKLFLMGEIHFHIGVYMCKFMISRTSGIHIHCLNKIP